MGRVALLFNTTRAVTIALQLHRKVKTSLNPTFGTVLVSAVTYPLEADHGEAAHGLVKKEIDSNNNNNNNNKNIINE